MHIFQPTAVRERVTEITPQFLQSLGVRALLLDCLLYTSQAVGAVVHQGDGADDVLAAAALAAFGKDGGYRAPRGDAGAVQAFSQQDVYKRQAWENIPREKGRPSVSTP